ncbi:ATP-binding cassette domain-containing protein [Streptomyces sp. NPDC050504]|uniref:ATP-binding cassette domain-containing protein n=1 Tax=Streptomyces sp. NPDC050504 TaxID=3365618 RepID=UPI003789C227
MRLQGVSKRYGRGSWVLRDVAADVPEGAVVAFRGGNGSGKSTLLRMIAGLSRPTHGTVTGRPDVVGYVPDRFAPAERMSAGAYLTHLGRIRGLGTREASGRARGLLERLALVGGADAELRTLSKGNAQKVALAQALLVAPGLLVLDEPWSGLDASAHGVLAEIVAEVARAGGAVVFTDHGEAACEARASHSYAVRDGRVTPTAVTAKAVAAAVTAVTLEAPRSGPAPRAVDWGAAPGALSVTVRESGAVVEVAVERARTEELLLDAVRAGWSVADVTRRSNSPGSSG